MRLFFYLIIFFTCTAVNAQDFRYGKVSKEELQETAHPKYPDASAAILYRNNYSHFDYNKQDGFILVTEIQERIKIYNAEGYDYSTKFIWLHKQDNEKEKVSGLKGVTYTLVDGDMEEAKLRNDGIFEEERDRYSDVTKFTMPNISDGAVIEYKYEIRSPFLGNLDEVRFQERIPLNKVESRYYFPEYFVFKLHSKGGGQVKIDESRRNRKLSLGITNSRPTGSLTSGYSPSSSRIRSVDFSEKIYTMTANDIAPLKEERFSGNLENYLTSIKFELSYIKFPDSPLKYMSTTWEDVAKNINSSDSFGDELNQTGYFNQDIDALIASAKNSKEKTFLIYEYVKNRMTWNEYLGFYAENGVKNAYKNKTGNVGDINLMLVAMLRYAGIDASPVLISTKHNGIPIFPTRNGFNYVVASAALDGGQILMDATNKLGEVNLLEEKLINWKGRLIKKDGSSMWVSLEPTDNAQSMMLVNVSIGDDLNTTGSLASRFMGHEALNYRKSYLGLTKEEARTKLEERNKGAEFSAIEFENLKECYKPVVLKYDFEPLSGVEKVGGKLLISPMFYLAEKENPFKQDDRQYPIDFGFAKRDRCSIIIKIPEGYKVESLPKSEAFKLFDDMANFSYSIKESLGNIQLTCERAINTALISPVYYSELKQFYDMVIKKQNQQIVLNKI